MILEHIIDSSEISRLSYTTERAIAYVWLTQLRISRRIRKPKTFNDKAMSPEPY